jgi:hypothetical protein
MQAERDHLRNYVLPEPEQRVKAGGDIWHRLICGWAWQTPRIKLKFRLS